MIKALAACATVLALAACATPVEKTASGEIPPSRIYIKSMIQQEAGLAQVRFSRSGTLLDTEMLELAINDVVLAQISRGEHLAIWVKPGRYDFSVKPASSLNSSSAARQSRLTVEVKSGAGQQVRITNQIRGLEIKLDGQ
jgi:hypothetical protein